MNERNPDWLMVACGLMMIAIGLALFTAAMSQ